MRWIAAALAAAVLLAGALIVLAAPAPFEEKDLARFADGNAAAGRLVFWAGGCASCHAAPAAEGAEPGEDARLVLAGGLALDTPFGTFLAPNISSHPQAGIGGWDALQFASAMKRGVSPDGAHYYPAFPYASYTRMSDPDVADLFAFMRTLPADPTPSRPHDLRFPYSIRAGLGLWKLANLSPDPVVGVADDPLLLRGRYLVEGPAHCGECHTPRNWTGGLDTARWLAGAPAPEGKGRVPDITPHPDGLGDWSRDEIVEALTSGFTPDYDSLGGSMADVVDNMARLPAGDREAIAAYLKAVPAP